MRRPFPLTARARPIRPAAFIVVMCLASVAQAKDWDLNVGRLCQLQTKNGQTLDCGGGYDFNVHGGVARVLPNNTAFRSLMSELGVLFAPNILAPAESIGFAGFNFGVELGLTSANTKRVATGTASGLPYWGAANAVSGDAFASGQLGAGELDTINGQLPGGIAPTITVMARKGFWLPVPTIEIGVGAKHLIGSSMWAGVLAAKLSLHEGFQKHWMPAFAVRGTASRVFGTSGFNLTVAGVDTSISKAFGVLETLNLTPYLGYQLLFVIAASGVIDATPGRDATELSRQAAAGDPLALASCNESVSQDCNAFFTFLDQSSIMRHRLFFGMRANFAYLSLVGEFSYFLAGSSSDTITTGATTTTVSDESGGQFSASFALMLEY